MWYIDPQNNNNPYILLAFKLLNVNKRYINVNKSFVF